MASHLPTPLPEREREMEKLAKKVFKDVWELFPEEVRSSQLEDGDHIYVYRAKGYSHHGIYVGRKNKILYVIHFSKDIPPCRKCRHEANHHAQLILTCLDCFLYEDIPLSSSLFRYRYGVDRLALPGTCTSLTAKPPKEVVKIAYELLENGFGEYHLLLNNCEDFATFCKTGVASSSQADYVAKSALAGSAVLVAGGAALAAFSIWFFARKNEQKKKKQECPQKE